MASKGPTVPNHSALFAIIWHLLALSVFTYGFRSLHSLSTLSGVDIEAQFGSHYQFLTIIGLWISRLGMILALIGDIFSGIHIVKTAKTFICVAALPVETLITLLYWTVVSIDPDLLIPPIKVTSPDNPAQFVLETVRMPLQIDLAMHAAPAVFLLVDFLLFSPPFPPSIRPMTISGCSTIAYCAWAEVCAYYNGHYPYPLLNVLSAPARLALYVACSATFVGVLEMVRLIHSRLDETWNRSWSHLDGQQGKGVVGEIDKRQ